MKNLLHSLQSNIRQKLKRRRYWLTLVIAGSVIVGCAIAAAFFAMSDQPQIDSLVQTRAHNFPVLSRYYAQRVRSGAASVAVVAFNKNPDTHINESVVLYERDANTSRLSASLIKLVTLLSYETAIGINDTETITVTADETSIEGFGFSIGDKVTADDLAHALLIASSNQSAETLGSLAKKHNVDLKTIGKQLYPNIVYDSLSGLDTTSSMTAREAATIAYDFWTLVPDIASASTQQYVPLGTNGSAHNTNVGLPSMKEIYFSKTGYTDEAGGNLVVLGRFCGRDIAIVVMGDTFSGRFDSVSRYVESLRQACSLSDYLARNNQPLAVVQ